MRYKYSISFYYLENCFLFVFTYSKESMNRTIGQDTNAPRYYEIEMYSMLIRMSRKSVLCKI